MKKRHFVSKKSELYEKKRCLAHIEGEDILVVLVQKKIFAVSNCCTHASAALNEGDIVGDLQIECPLHGAVFDLATGEALEGPAIESIKIYSIVEDGDDIYIEL